MIQLDPNQKATAKAFFYTLLYISKLDDSDRMSSPVFQAMSPKYLNFIERQVDRLPVRYQKGIFEILKTCEASVLNIQRIQNIIDAIHEVLLGHFLAAPDANTLVTLPKETLYNYFAWVCHSWKWIWDNTQMMPQDFAKLMQLPLGEALAAFECFRMPLTANGTAASVDNTPSEIAQVTKNITPGSSARKIPDYDPKRDYKKLGPLSKNMSKILKDPNKVTFSNLMFCLESDTPNNTTKRTLFITPIDVWGTFRGSYSSKEVKIGSANGYTDCQLWWDDYADAELVLSELNKGSYSFKNRKGTDTFRIKKAKPDPNGYFYVDTAVGPAYIKAQKVNEELTEDNQQVEKQATTTNSYKINNIDVFSEAFLTYGD